MNCTDALPLPDGLSAARPRLLEKGRPLALIFFLASVFLHECAKTTTMPMILVVYTLETRDEKLRHWACLFYHVHSYGLKYGVVI